MVAKATSDEDEKGDGTRLGGARFRVLTQGTDKWQTGGRRSRCGRMGHHLWVSRRARAGEACRARMHAGGGRANKQRHRDEFFVRRPLRSSSVV